ncbi:hypothetical protein CROQUDRAFT_382316 [Cronartium quercuum f. sp. fusiforme G11]|uniref:S-adenosyl-L-methionine-dependent methyltransferase n=1 Tax=Cronartium quercuum f. sp. fusiforme G11 TaxID=708437 RepID=A0A9P6N6P6_9BASI|nr:hypothetical protein CROQUDRAFT_382316 [Cronartium quercuum f. sp. fusiforme G11]
MEQSSSPMEETFSNGHCLTTPSIQLPTLSTIRTLSSTCCIALSCPLILALRRTFTSSGDGQILSVGSGSGLLEAYMVADGMNVIGIDLESTNKYLPPERFVGIRGTWDMGPGVLLTSTRKLLFAYPKPVDLVLQRYIKKMAKLEMIVWIGPATDWPEVVSALDQVASWSNESKEIFDVTEPYERFMVMRCERRAGD